MEKISKKNAHVLLHRITALCLCLILICCTFAGCGKQKGETSARSGGALTPVILNEVAHSILYPDIDNTD